MRILLCEKEELREVERNTESWKEIILIIEGQSKSSLPWNPEPSLNPELSLAFPGLFSPLSFSSKVSQYQIYQQYWDTLNQFWDSQLEWEHLMLIFHWQINFKIKIILTSAVLLPAGVGLISQTFHTMDQTVKNFKLLLRQKHSRRGLVKLLW